ncbi:MAG: MerR family DNA-binding transcriptional regulator [Methylococcales bacterium]
MKKQSFTISELAEEFDITSRTLRFYEEQGILSPDRKGNRRLYSRQDHGRIKMTLRGKRLGFSLLEIKEIIEMYDSKTGQVGQLVLFLKRIREHVDMLEIQIEDIHLTLSELKRFEQHCEDLLDKKNNHSPNDS